MRIWKTAHRTYRDERGTWVDAHPPTPSAQYRFIQWPGNYDPPWPAYITWMEESGESEYPEPDWANIEDHG